MLYLLITFATSLIGASTSASAQILPCPAAFQEEEIETDGTAIHVRVGGQGPGVVLLHGYGETGDLWAPLAADLARDHQVMATVMRFAATDVTQAVIPDAGHCLMEEQPAATVKVGRDFLDQPQ